MHELIKSSAATVLVGKADFTKIPTAVYTHGHVKLEMVDLDIQARMPPPTPSFPPSRAN